LLLKKTGAADAMPVFFLPIAANYQLTLFRFPLHGLISIHCQKTTVVENQFWGVFCQWLSSRSATQ